MWQKLCKVFLNGDYFGIHQAKFNCELEDLQGFYTFTIGDGSVWGNMDLHFERYPFNCYRTSDCPRPTDKGPHYGCPSYNAGIILALASDMQPGHCDCHIYGLRSGINFGLRTLLNEDGLVSGACSSHMCRSDKYRTTCDPCICQKYKKQAMQEFGKNLDKVEKTIKWMRRCLYENMIVDQETLDEGGKTRPVTSRLNRADTAEKKKSRSSTTSGPKSSSPSNGTSTSPDSAAAASPTGTSTSPAAATAPTPGTKRKKPGDVTTLAEATTSPLPKKAAKVQKRRKPALSMPIVDAGDDNAVDSTAADDGDSSTGTVSSQVVDAHELEDARVPNIQDHDGL